MPGVPTFFKCISIMSVMKKSFCVGEMKKKKAEMSVWGHKIHRFWLTCTWGSKMLKFYPKEGQSLKGVWGLISKKTFCLLSVVSEGSVQGMGMGSVFC